MFVLQEYAKGGNQKPQIEERQTIQWTKEKGQTTIRIALRRKLNIGQHESQ
jgi:hypothetical protein